MLQGMTEKGVVWRWQRSCMFPDTECANLCTICVTILLHVYNGALTHNYMHHEDPNGHRRIQLYLTDNTCYYQEIMP